MIEGNGADCVVKFKVVLERGVVAFPSDHIVGTELALTFKDFSNILVINLNSFSSTVHSSFLS